MRSCENIQEIVKEYLTLDIANSAIMIDGEWGSGKTYFIRNKLRPYIEKDLGQKCIYISLNGVSDRDNISKEIFLSSVNFSKKNIPNWLKIAKNYGFEVSKILFEKMSITDKSVNYINIARLEKCVLIFDDLERCLIDIREVLGYINRFVELENVPTIIVANENEIDSRILYYNRELKYLLATSDKIDFPNNDKSEANAIIKDNSNNSNKLSLSNLENRTEHLFGSENDYDHIKEKLVSKTISFVPDLDEIIDVIIENYTLSEVEKKVVTLCKNDIIHYFTKENHYNIRTLEFVFANYDKICKAIKSYDYSDDEKSECLSKIILYITAFSIRYKKGLYIAPWGDTSSYGYVNLSGEPWSFVHILGFSFINDLITDSYLNVELMLSSLSDFCNSQKKLAKNDDDPLNLLTYWDYLEDNEVKKYLAILSEKVRDNLYEYSLYPKIIDKLLRLSIMGFDASIEETIGFMKNNIRQEINVNIQTIDSFIYPNNDEYNERLLSYLNQINEEIEKKHIKGFTNGINACVTGKEGWGKQLIDYVDTHRNELMNKRRFVSLFDTTNFCESILKSKNKDIEDVRRAFQSVYNFSNIRDFYKNDYSSISVIIDRLKETQKGDHKFGIIKFECINYFINQLSEYLSRLD